jgi:hypothetical protein
MTTPLLIHVDPSKPFVLETNAYDFIVGTVLSQLGKNNLLHLVDFCFHKFFLKDINYNIHDKKFIAIVDAFKKWHHLLKGAQHEIIVYLHHKNFRYFMRIHVLNQHQA